MAETVFAVTQTPLGTAPRQSDGLLDLGPPIDGVAISIRDGDGRPVPDGGFGEIALRGDFLLAGYYRDPALTAERLRDGWLYTRDRGRLIGRALQVAGRLDDVLIVNGRKFHGHDVEAAVDALGVAKAGRCAAFTQYDERVGGNVLIVVAERRAGHDDDEIAARIAERIRAVFDVQPSDVRLVAAGWMRIAERIRAVFDVQPSDVRLVAAGWIVKTTSGKISRGDNRDKYRAQALADV